MRTAHIQDLARDLSSSNFYLPAWGGSRVGNKSSFETKTLGACAEEGASHPEKKEDRMKGSRSKH